MSTETEVQKFSPLAEGEDMRKYKDVPKSIKKIIYDKDDDVLFGSRMTKGKVMYEYIPGEFMTTGRDYICGSSCTYDGKGNVNLPKDAELMHYSELKDRFTDNTFTE